MPNESYQELQDSIFHDLELENTVLRQRIIKLEALADKMGSGWALVEAEKLQDEVFELRKVQSAYLAMIDVKRELQSDLEFAYKRSKVLADLLNIPVHESPEVTGTILGLVRGSLERLIAERKTMAEAILQVPLLKNHPAWQVAQKTIND